MLVSAARVAARDGSWRTAAAQALAGLALWRGEPLADVSSEILAAREIPRLLEMRLQATEIHIDADLRLGRTAEVIADLRQLADANPLRERFPALLMLALYRDERQGEALAVYQRARDMLGEELGIVPGAGLREMHRRVLAADPALSQHLSEHGRVADHSERWRSTFTQVEMREMWTYTDGGLTTKAYRRRPDGTGRAGSWALVDQGTGNVQGVVPAGEFSRLFRPVDAFADVPKLSTYLGTVTAPDGTALVDLLLDRNPFMLANGPRRTARPHALMVPRYHRDGWSGATAAELSARHTAMTLVAAWYRGLDGGHAVFCANDSPPNLDYLRDANAASETLAGRGPDAAVTKNPRQDVQHAHLHAFYAEHGELENHESSALKGHLVMAEGFRAFSAVLGSDAVPVGRDGTGLAAGLRAAAQPWGGSYCSYQLGADGPLWVMPVLGPAQDEVNHRLARADGLQAEPDPTLGGAVNVVRPTLADAGRLDAAQRATADQRVDFETFVAGRGLDARSLKAAGRN